MANLITGVDIGGTHITVGLVDTDTGKIFVESRSRGYVDTSLDKDSIISSWVSVIRESQNKSGISAGKTGIAMPGPFDYDHGISYIKGLHKYESLYGLNVKEMLTEELNIAPTDIRMINDASAYLLGEKSAGAGRGYDNIVGITLGTGLGSAAFHHNQLEEGDLYCTDFEAGKCEDYASARWLIAEYERLTGLRVSGVREIADSCSNDDSAREAFSKFGEMLYRILHLRYKSQEPDLIIIGGNIAKAWQWFMPSLQTAMGKTGFYFGVAPAELGEDAALIGAACLWK